jgi:hypothetical protein
MWRVEVKSVAHTAHNVSYKLRLSKIEKTGSLLLRSLSASKDTIYFIFNIFQCSAPLLLNPLLLSGNSSKSPSLPHSKFPPNNRKAETKKKRLATTITILISIAEKHSTHAALPTRRTPHTSCCHHSTLSSDSSRQIEQRGGRYGCFYLCRKGNAIRLAFRCPYLIA